MNETVVISSSLDKAIPRIREYELDQDSARYDYSTAAPPDDQLVIYWYIWSVVTFVCGTFSLVVCLSIAVNRKLRRKPFNLYIIYLMIPDFVFSLLCSVTCLLNATKGSYWSHDMCNFQQFYVVFGIGANAWLNSIIAHQLHSILRLSSERRRYTLPTRKQVRIHAFSVYAWCLFLGSWGFNNTEKFPYESGQASGLACTPLEGDSTTSVIFFWLFFFPLFAGIPIVYVLWICWDIYHRQLMPPRGQRRLFTIYFGRLIFVFLALWIPTILFIFLLMSLPSWVPFVGGTLSHLQGGVSALLVLMKPDIRDSFRNFITCRCHDEKGNDVSTRPSSGRMSFWPRTESGDLSASMRNSHRRYGSGELEAAAEFDRMDSAVGERNSLEGTNRERESSLSGIEEDDEGSIETINDGDQEIQIKDCETIEMNEV